MEIPTWLMWLVALMLAIVPLSILPIAMKVDKVRPKKRRAKPVEFIPMVAGDGFIVYREEDLLLLVSVLAGVQMRQRWGKDIDYIV